jgi:hypothetical protein
MKRRMKATGFFSSGWGRFRGRFLAGYRSEARS